MGTDFKLTQDEINRAIMHSPYVLADSPSQRGLGAGQIKRYFYDFITQLATALNLHFDDISAYAEGLNNAINGTKGVLDTHVGSPDAHADIRGLITEVQNGLERYKAEDKLTDGEIRGLVTALGEALEGHKSDEGVHGDIRGLVALAQEKAESAYNLARGRTKVHVSVGIKEHIYGLLHYGETEGYNEGDILLSAESGVPDFIIAIKGSGFGGDYYEITDADVLPAFSVGQIYKVGDYAIAAIESGIDTGAFATKEELNSKASELMEAIEEKQSGLTIDDVPMLDSENLVKSGGVAKYIYDCEQQCNRYTDERIEGIASGQNKKKYELIGEYTVEPMKDENGEVILDEGGNPVFPEVFKISGFELTDFYINAKMAYASTSAKTTLFANELALFGSLGISGMKEDGTLRSWECFYNSYGEGAGGIVSFLAGTIAASAEMPNSSIFNSNTVFVPPTKTGFNNITSISIQAVGSAFVEGSKIKLYGVKK